ncbi:MAG: ABC transporter permease [Hyphomicrobiales bacterium]|nr:MAG: ABC transporter permease [Hyphomicrobiales bacterium]
MSQQLSDQSQKRSGMRKLRGIIKLLFGDSFAVMAFGFLAILFFGAIFGPSLIEGADVSMNLKLRNAPPFDFSTSFGYWLGADSLGRPILPRLLIAARTTLAISLSVVFLSMIIGSALGIVAGFYTGRMGNIIMRGADLVMSFPSLLLAVIVLYVLKPYVFNVVIVLAITRIPVYIRVARAEVLEVKERLFVESARSMGASDWRILRLHIAPIILPTLLTVASLDLANVMLAESSLSFLGIGVQPPSITWGLMVADGRNYLTSAWWLAFWPGMAILLTALSANLLSNWMRIAMDPKLRWRLEKKSTSTDATAAPSDGSDPS